MWPSANPVPQVGLETLNQWLDDARNALHRLLTGAAVVEIVADGYVTKFARADADKLRAYIGRLEAQIRGFARPTGIGIVF